jgi:signal transduction histidine kinase
MSGMPPGVAHEMRQPLNAIKLGNDFLKMMLRKGQTISQDQLNNVVQEIDRQVDRASGIITRLIEIGQGSTFESEPLDLNRPFRETLGIMENELPLENIAVKLDLAEGLPPVMGNRRRLAQIFFSIITNAREAIHEKIQRDPKTHNGVIEIRTFREGNRLIAMVTDSGVGIPPYAKDRIFEPFFSSKERGKGLGLAISRQIMKAYDGKIEVHSEEGVGTTIKLTFPVT